MFEGFEKTLKNQIDKTLAPIEADENGYGQVRPVHILDMGNLIGNNVVSGGVRRTAEIFLFDVDDYETMMAKYDINGLWTQKDLDHHIHVGELLEEQGIKPAWFDDLTKHTELKLQLFSKEAETGAWGTLAEATKYFEQQLALEKGIEVVEPLVEYNEVFENYLPLLKEQKQYYVRENLNHRRMSNNSIAFLKKPTRKQLHLIFEMMKGSAEPGFMNLEAAKKRRPNAEGFNPCGEIILDDEQVCNLTTINVRGFVYQDEDGNYFMDDEGLKEAQRMSTRIGVRMTLAELELPEWDVKQKRDHLVGTSVTGWQDAKDLVGWTDEEEVRYMEMLRKTARDEANRFAFELRIPSPLLVTTVKPEGTLSQVAGGVSSGVHMSHAPYFIRRVRVKATDPLAKVALDLGWTVHAEVGTKIERNGEVIEVINQEELATQELLDVATTLVVDFPNKGGATRTKEDADVNEQFDTYFRFQKHYTEHNSSNTITVRPDEWGQAEQRVWDGWDNFIGVSFMELDSTSYTLAPYETITEEEYHVLKADMKPFDALMLRQYETNGEDFDLLDDVDCSSGVCPVR